VAATLVLTSSLPSSGPHYFPTDLPFVTDGLKGLSATTPEELPSFRKRGQAPSLLHRVRRSFRLGLIDWRYRPELARAGRSRTFTGQCCQPFCPGDLTSYSGGPRPVTKFRCMEERIGLPGLRPAWGIGPPPEPSVTPPGLSSPGPFVTGCYLPALATYPLARFEGRLPHRLGPARVGFDFIRSPFPIKSHRLTD
jgi:hypothetical protein